MKLKFNWAPQVISQDGVWVKKDAADKRLTSLYILIGFLNVLLWGVIFFK